MLHIATIPLRQKITLSITIISGLLLALCSVFNWMKTDSLNTLILLYSIFIPFSLLLSSSVIDLNDINVFRMWLLIAAILFTISLTTYNSPRFMIHRAPRLAGNKFIGNYSTSSLKALLIFLLSYWPLNKLLNKKGVFIINTFRQSKWYHNEAQRKITGLDVLINFFLLITTVLAVLFGH